ncbi:MAG: class I SAM-dependent methyltransferase [Syntrophales bacterium]|nr:class I SAM-dependent methyltransferase [Syntrophales bacterium]
MRPSSATRDTRDCPYCRAPGYFYFPFYRRNYYHCPSCDLIFNDRREDRNAVNVYYRDQYFDDCADDQTEGKRTGLYGHILDLLETHIPPGSILDVGCGCGFFLKEARERGWMIIGLDPSAKSISYANEVAGVDAVMGTISDLPSDRRFDAVVLINVLDHIALAWQELDSIRERLAPQGVVYLRFPNGIFHAAIVRFFFKFTIQPIANRFLVFHEYAFTPRFIKRCLNDRGFSVVQIQNSRLTADTLHNSIWNPVRFLGNAMHHMIWAFFKSLEVISFGRLLYGPSLEVVAKNV